MPDTPTAAPQQPISHWRVWHSLSIVAIIIVFVWMALERPWGLYGSWLIVIAVLTLFTFIVGDGVTGVWKGAFVDERNRMSLSRLQMITWTVVVVSAFGTIAIGRLTQTPSTQADIVSALDIGVPQTIWLLLGISTTSFIGSPLIKNAKKESAPALTDDKVRTLLEKQSRNLNHGVEAEGQILKNLSITDASWADMFMGENIEDASHLEIGKMQMFFFTVLLVFSYAFAIGTLLRTTTAPTSLPDIGQGMLPLLGLSHAGYLASKVASSPSSPASES